MGSSSRSSLSHQPDGPWKFDDAVTHVFDDMLERSIPEYGAMRRLVFELGRPFVPPGGVIVDLGTSRGGALSQFVDALSENASYVGVEVSPSMLHACRTRFAAEIAAGRFSLLDLDLRSGYPKVGASLTLAVLTLQFVPVEARARVVGNVYQHTVAGGAFILVEKVRGTSALSDGLLTDQYHGLKRAHGYGEDAIERKRLSLEGVLVPATAAANEELLRGAGFATVECFWRHLNFAAWIAIKGDQTAEPCD